MSRFGRAVLLLCAGAACAAAAPPDSSIQRLPVIDRHDIRFVPLSVNGERFQRRVHAMAQDNYGFVWLGTDDGLYRYDGYTFRPYRHDPNDRHSLSDNTVMCIYKDRTGILWIGTANGGLDRFDEARDSFTQFRHDSSDNSSLRNDEVLSIYRDLAGSLWVGTSDGLDRLDVTSGRFYHYPHPSDKPGTYEIWGLYEDGEGNLLVGCPQGLYKLERSTGSFSLFSKGLTVLDHDVQWFAKDRSGAPWFTLTYQNIFGVLDTETGRLRRYAFDSEDGRSQHSAIVSRFHEDRNGVLWIGTIRDGLLKLEPGSKNLIRYAPGPESGISGQIWELLEDSEGNMWVGSDTGVTRFQTAPHPFVNYQHEPGNQRSLAGNKVLTVHADTQGFLWIGTDGGLQRLDRKTGQMILYQHDPKDPSSLSFNTVSAIKEDGSGGLWIGTGGGGLNRFERASGRFVSYRHNSKDPQSLSSDVVGSLSVEPEGVLWVGTLEGLDRFDPATGRFKVYRHDAQDPHSLSHDVVRTTLRDRAGTFWVGTLRGLNRFDRGTRGFTVYLHDERSPTGLSSDGVASFYEDHEGNLWIGTFRGLDRLDRTRGSFERFTTQDGLADDYIEEIREDSQGNLWLATHAGLSEFRPQTKAVRNYTEADGLPGDFQNPNGTERSCATPEGELVFGSEHGITVFDPNRVSANPFVPPVVLTDFLLFNKPVAPGRDSPLQQPIWTTHSLTLNHDQNILTLGFAALSYVAPERNRYRYKMENLDKQWSEVGGDRRAVTYTNVPPGKYFFRVQGSNNDQVWNEAGVNLAITVLPAWYATWWFQTAVVLSVVGLALVVYRLRTRALRLTAARLERQVAERTIELKAAKETAEVAKNAAEVAKDVAETANRAKSAFLSHMSHELRTPLNAILGFARLAREDGVSEKQRAADLDVIHRSGEHLLGLINDVLDIAKIEAGRTTVEIAPCDLARLVRDVTDMMRVRAAEKNLELRLEQLPEFPQFVETDAKKLREMLINLLGNAIKHTERGSVTLRLNSQPGAPQPAGGPEHVLLSFEVQDTGVGIALEDQERIFEPFVQVGKETRQKGTGLGLAITRQFAVLLGGSLRVTSALGEGSTFRLEVPAKHTGTVVTDSDGAEREYVLAARQPEYRILVVDDDPENRRLLQRLLEHAGFQVRVAEDGAQGVEVFQSWRPHFIWMDLRMPEVDGAEATRRIRALEGGQQMKIAAVTASELTHSVAGMDDLVHKPYRAREIFECMARHLGVSYRTADAVPSPPVETIGVLRPEALAALPDELREELTKAVVSLNISRITPVIKRVAELDPALGAALAFHADRFAFTAVLKALQECKSDVL